MEIFRTKLQKAKDPNMPDIYLTQLAEVGNEKVRAAVAANKNVQRQTLDTLSKDSSLKVRKAVATNPMKMTEQIWDILNADPEVQNILLEHYPERPQPHNRRS